jgi:hypothetical protein
MPRSEESERTHNGSATRTDRPGMPAYMRAGPRSVTVAGRQAPRRRGKGDDTRLTVDGDELTVAQAFVWGRSDAAVTSPDRTRWGEVVLGVMFSRAPDAVPG